MNAQKATKAAIFSAPMVRALLDGRKTQTRRPVKATTDRNFGCVLAPSEIAGEVNHGDYTHSRYGAPGDLLWVRETFSGPHCMEASEGCAAAPPSKWGRSSRIWYWADGNPQDGDWTRPRPSIHMPRWASRLTLRITDVRVQRLQEISDADAKAEGVSPAATHATFGYGGLDALNDPHEYVRAFRDLWESIYGRESWNANPFVWALTFDVLRSNIEDISDSQQPIEATAP